MAATELRFIGLCDSLNVPSSIASPTANQLHELYSEPHRFYHTLQHISALLKGMDAQQGWGNRTAVELAIWFHDCIYDPAKGAPYNELESIKVWEEFADQAGLESYKAQVSALIYATISHTIPSPTNLPSSLSAHDIAHFLDLDISILAAPPSSYALYASQIRKEYIHVKEKDYCTGRSKVLEGFLGREKLFLGEGREEDEERARGNLREEVEGLKMGRIMV